MYVEPPEGDEAHDAVTMRGKPARSTKKEMPAADKPMSAKKDIALTEPININKAASEELQRLPGIGPTMAGRIIEARKTTPFKSVDDLRHVHGIGVKTLDKLRPHVTVGEGKEDSTK